MIKLFTDGSSHPQTNIGFGAYLLILDDTKSIELLKADIKTKMFKDTSSTKLEVQTMLWALKNISQTKEEIIIYTDCQNIIGLPNRRKRLEANNYLTKKGKRIANHDLYKEFYKLTDSLNCQFIKVKGHKESSQKDEIDKIFTLVDKTSRDKLRNELL
ncbi:MAG: ribonuclease H [Arcobacter sp.]|nr:ribonuclease H [Arcobacter sp.]|tara:strand:+ start:18932 stop:19405 length:474 start_codon:yes stop_codon:yes gene_type:complete